LSGCHVKGSQAPYLSADVSYQQLLGGFVNTIKPDQSELYIQINGNMQVHIPNADDRQKIYDWIRTGASVCVAVAVLSFCAKQVLLTKNSETIR